MKTTHWVTVDKEVEINIGSDDIHLILSEKEPTKENLHHIKADLNEAFTFMKGLPDSVIDALGEPAKKTIYDAFTEQIARFNPNHGEDK